MNRWAVAFAAFFGAIVVGAIAYQFGVSHGLALGGQVAGGGAAPLVVPYGYYRPWGFGFPFLFPLVFFAFWVFLFRGMCWRGGGRRERLDEWHRRAHEAMNSPSAPDRARS